MNITTNYQLKTFNYARLNNQPLQTNPSFGNKNKLIIEGVKAAAGAVAAGTVLAMQNGNGIPTREEFQKMLVNDGITTTKEVDKWLKVYDHNPGNAISFFTMTDISGHRCAKYVDGPTSFIKSDPILALEIINTETDNGIQPFSLSDANTIINLYDKKRDYTNGIRRMLGFRDEIGNLRFSVPNDYIASWAFEKYPEIATQCAYAKDNNGNYRFSGEQIKNIVRAKTSGEYSPEKIDEFMNMQRHDGSYVNNEFYWRNFEIYMENPEEYKQLCDITIADDRHIKKCDIEDIITHYIKYPDEIKEILQTMPRFSIDDLKELGTKAGLNLHIAPKSFRTLANLRIADGFAFSLEEICDIIEKYELDKKEADNSEEFKATLKMLSILGRLTEQECYHHKRALSLEQIFKASEIYKKYPVETVDIIKYYYRTPEYDVLIPTEDDIKLYKENRAEFNKKYLPKYFDMERADAEFDEKYPELA